MQNLLQPEPIIILVNPLTPMGNKPSSNADAERKKMKVDSDGSHEEAAATQQKNEEQQEQEDDEQFLANNPIQRLFALLRRDLVDVDAVKEIVNGGNIDLNTPDVAPTIPENANLKDPQVQKLLRRIQNRTYLGDYALHLLVGRPSSQNTPELVDLVKLFFLKEHPMNARNILGSTPLHRACAAGNAAMAAALISWGSSADAANNMNLTALHMACYAGHTEVVKLLLQNGCAKQITFKSDMGLAPCDFILNDEILQLLKSAHKQHKAGGVVAD